MSDNNLPDNPAGVVHLNDGNFGEALKKYNKLVVDFWAAWCGPCMMMSPVIDELAKENSPGIVFAKVNVDENQEIPQEYGIRSIPTFMLFKDGETAGQIIGGMPKKDLLTRITDTLK